MSFVNPQNSVEKNTVLPSMFTIEKKLMMINLLRFYVLEKLDFRNDQSFQKELISACILQRTMEINVFIELFMKKIKLGLK